MTMLSVPFIGLGRRWRGGEVAISGRVELKSIQAIGFEREETGRW
jgi:hypothetical protein